MNSSEFREIVVFDDFEIKNGVLGARTTCLFEIFFII
jgi:hypothetical protein